jgi:hypothetical protein
MGTSCGGRSRQDRLHRRQIQQLVVFAARNQPQAAAQHIGQWSGIAIESIETDDDVLQGDRHLFCIGNEELNGSEQFAPVIAIPWAAKSSQELMGMRLENHRTCAHDFSAFAALVALRRTPDQSDDEG